VESSVVKGTARSGDIDIAYESHGHADDPVLVLIPGLGNQLLFFENEFVEGLVDRAFRVVRIDNRDVGLSSSLDQFDVDLSEVLAAVGRGQQVVPPYTLGDMATDVVAVLDHLGVDEAHVLGVSLGGMVAQNMAVSYPARVRSLTLISSTSGSSDVGQPSPEAMAALLTPGPTEGREALVEHDTKTRKIWATTAHYDEEWTQLYFLAAYHRAHNPAGSSRQMVAVLTEPDREPALAQLTVPTLVLHGSDDVLIDPSGGARLVELIPDAEFLELEAMGHDLPPHYWSPIIEAVTQLAIRSA